MRTLQLWTFHDAMTTSLQMLTLPLSQADCQLAQSQAKALPHRLADGDFKHRHQCATLAALAARYYFRLLGIHSELILPPSGSVPSDSVPSGSLALADNQQLHCLPVVDGQLLSDYSSIDDSSADWLPASARASNSASLGAIAIQIDLPRRQAQIMGFLPDHLPRKFLSSLQPTFQLTLQPISMLINRLSTSPIHHLQQWLVGHVSASWQQCSRPRPAAEFCFRSSDEDELTPAVETTLLNVIRHTADEEQRWQAAEQLWNLDPTHPESPILRAKDMGLYLLGCSVTLLVGILVKPNQQRLILVRLLPLGEALHLPPEMTLTGEDEAGNTVFTVRSRQQDDYIQFNFTADVGDRFDLHIGWQSASLTEQFVV